MRLEDTMGEGFMLCAIEMGSVRFGIDTRRIREVLGVTRVQQVPLARPFIAGMVAYRGDVLTAVSLRALLGMPRYEEPSCLLVMDGEGQWNGGAEPFGLMVDFVGGVIAVGEDLLARNPPPLEERLRRIFQAAFCDRLGLIVQLDTDRMRPELLMAGELN